MSTRSAIGGVIFTPTELGREKKLHPATIRRMFLDEPGVIRLGTPRGPGRRQRFTLRIPEEVANRVFARLTVGGRFYSGSRKEVASGNP
jgi:hypothetical protein